MEVERHRLARLGYSDSVLNTLMAGRRSSTNRVCNYTWSALLRWYSTHQILPEKIKVKDFLGFLQSGLDMGLSMVTTKRQVSAIA